MRLYSETSRISLKGHLINVYKLDGLKFCVKLLDRIHVVGRLFVYDSVSCFQEQLFFLFADFQTLFIKLSGHKTIQCLKNRHSTVK